MSQASDLAAELKQLVADATKDLKAFEGDLGEVGQFTDLAHLNIAKIHLTEFRNVIAAREADALVDHDADAAAYAEFIEARTPAGFVPQPAAPERSMAPTPDGAEPVPEVVSVAPEPAGEPVAPGPLDALVAPAE